MTDINLDILPQRPAVSAGRATELHALIRVRAPAKPAAGERERAPLNLALVLDRSGSMNYRPLEEAKRCASYVVDRMGADDRLSIVTYDNRVDVVVPRGRVTDRKRIQRAIEAIAAGGYTALFDGWDAGAREAVAGISDRNLTRVLLLSDGCANRGLTDAREISRRVASMFEEGVSTSTYGLGHHFNEELMVEIAQAGGGQSYYGETAEDLLDPFQEELSLMSSLCARKLKLTLSTPKGVEAELLNPYRKLGDHTWQLPDLAFEGEAWALLRLTVQPEFVAEAKGAELDLLRAFLALEGLDTPDATTLYSSLTLPCVTPGAWSAIAEDGRVLGRLQEVQVARLQRQAREAARKGDWAAVDAIVIRAEKEAGNNAWVRESLEGIRRYARARDRERMSKEAMYASRRMESRLAACEEKPELYDRDEQFDLPEFLRRKPEQGKRMR